MSISFIIFIVIHILALAYFLETIRRVRHRAKEYPLTESKETVPFGLIRLGHAVVLYGFFYLLWLVFSFVFYFRWLEALDTLPSQAPTETFLNL